MDNSLAANRRLAVQLVAAQATLPLAVALVLLPWQGAAAAVAAVAGGWVIALGSALLALPVFAPALAGAGTTLARFAVGTLLKWAVVLVGFYVILAHWKLPAVPALAGLVAALLANFAMLARLKR